MFEWDDANIGHIAEHGIAPDETEDALADPNRRTVPSYSPPAEIREAILGATGSGRLLFVVFTFRQTLIRVVTARDANRDTELPLYLRDREL